MVLCGSKASRKPENYHREKHPLAQWRNTKTWLDARSNPTNPLNFSQINNTIIIITPKNSAYKIPGFLGDSKRADKLTQFWILSLRSNKVVIIGYVPVGVYITRVIYLQVGYLHVESSQVRSNRFAASYLLCLLFQ